MTGFLDTLRKLGPVRLGVMAAVALGMIGFFVFLGGNVSGRDWRLLYADLEASDGAAIVERLQALNIPTQVSDDGARVSVPASEVGRARMVLAAEGLPSGGKVGYELFDGDSGFGTTAFVQDVNRLRAMEGELSRTIATLTPVRSARVHLVLPKRELFSRDSQPASASVFVRLKQGASLSNEQVAAIRHLVASAVPGLSPNAITLTDDTGALLARPDGEGEVAGAAEGEGLRRAAEQRLTRAIEELLGRTVGYGRVRAQVSVELDLDRVASEERSFDPEQAVPRQTTEIEESEQSEDRDQSQGVTVANNLPGAQAGGAGGAGSSSRANRTEATTNFEIGSRTVSTVRQPGAIRRISAAVLVDGRTVTDPQGVTTWQPRDAAELERLATLVRSAIGFDADRGDVVEVVNMEFAPEDLAETPEAPALFGVPLSELSSIAETLVLGVIAALALLLVVRPLLARVLDVKPAEGGATLGPDGTPLLTDQRTGVAGALTGPPGSTPLEPLADGSEPGTALARTDEPEEMIDLGNVEGRVKASVLKRIGEIVEKHPQEAVAILRSWMYQEG